MYRACERRFKCLIGRRATSRPITPELMIDTRVIVPGLMQCQHAARTNALLAANNRRVSIGCASGPRIVAFIACRPPAHSKKSDPTVRYCTRCIRFAFASRAGTLLSRTRQSRTPPTRVMLTILSGRSSRRIVLSKHENNQPRARRHALPRDEFSSIRQRNDAASDPRKSDRAIRNFSLEKMLPQHSENCPSTRNLR